MMHNGHRGGKWQENHGVGARDLSTGMDRDACNVATALVKFVAVYDEEGKLIEHQDVVWETGESKDGKKLIAGEELPNPTPIMVDLEHANCNQLTTSASAQNLGMN
jgi:hypothetical protein